MSKIVGYLILALGVLLVLVLWTNAKKREVAIPVTATTFLFSALALISFAFINSEDVTEVEITKGFTLRKAVSQARTDLSAISELKTRVEGQSSLIEGVASQASSANQAAAKANQNVIATQSQLEAASLKVSELNELVEEAGKQSFSLRQQTQISSLILEAENDSRPAFDALAVRAADDFDPYHETAHNAYASIYNSHNQGINPNFSINWNPGFEPQKASISSIIIAYRELAASTSARAALIQIVGSRNDIAAVQKMTWIVDLINNETSLLDLEQASRIFDQLTEQKFAPLDTKNLLSWWHANRDDWSKAHLTPADEQTTAPPRKDAPAAKR